MNLLPDSEPQEAVQLNVSIPLVQLRKDRPAPPLFCSRTTATTAPQIATVSRLSALERLPAELINRICMELDPVDLYNLSACSQALASTVDTRRFRQTHHSFYGEAGSPRATASCKRFYPVYKRFQSTLYQTLFGPVRPSGWSQPVQPPVGLSPEQVLDCALGLRIKSQSGALQPAVWSFNKKCSAPVWSSAWVGWIAGLGQCRIGLPAWTERDGIHLPMQILDPHQGPKDFPSLQVSLALTCGERTDRKEAALFLFPAGTFKITAVQDRMVIAYHSFGMQLWQMNCTEGVCEVMSATLPVQTATVIIETGPECIAIGCQNGCIQIWAISSEIRMRQAHRLHQTKVTGLLALPDNRLLSGSLDGLLKLWQTDRGDVIASHKLPLEGSCLAAIVAMPDRFITRSMRDVLCVWQVTDTDFHCIAVLSPCLVRSGTQEILYDEQMFHRLRRLWALFPFFLHYSATLMANDTVVRATAREGFRLQSPQVSSVIIEVYDLNAPPHIEDMMQIRTGTNSPPAAVWEPRFLPDHVGDGPIVLLETLPDGRVVVASTCCVVICEPLTGHVLELLHWPQDEEESSEGPLSGGCVSADGFIWLYGRESAIFVVDPFADINPCSCLPVSSPQDPHGQPSSCEDEQDVNHSVTASVVKKGLSLSE